MIDKSGIYLPRFVRGFLCMMLILHGFAVYDKF